MHRSDFCLAGAFRDWFLFRRSDLLRALGILLGLNAAAFAALAAVGALPAFPFPLLGTPTLAGTAGGFLFGVGMVLAGGCVVGILYKMGAGSGLAAAGLLGIVAGSAVYAEVHTAWRRVAEAVALGADAVTLPRLVGVSCLWAGLAGACCLLLLRNPRRGASEPRARSPVRGYLAPARAAWLLSAVSVASVVLVGMPVGITTFYAKLAAWAEGLVVPRHADGLAFFAAVPLDVHLPLWGVRLRGGPGAAWDGIAAVQGPVILGIVLGALGSATRLGEFRVRIRAPLRQYGSAVLGGILLGLGARLGSGCNVWHLLGGIPLLAGQSLLFAGGMVPGAWVGSRILTRFVLPAPCPATLEGAAAPPAVSEAS
jgi:hypothetical protein